MHENFLDEAEIAALTQLLFARYESEFFYDDASRSKFVNRVLSDIAHHYGGSTNDFMMSFDRITGLLADFH
ncbi:hypothetical protein AAVH_31278, partial [Aphelenchoides avenae]